MEKRNLIETVKRADFTITLHDERWWDDAGHSGIGMASVITVTRNNKTEKRTLVYRDAFDSRKDNWNNEFKKIEYSVSRDSIEVYNDKVVVIFNLPGRYFETSRLVKVVPAQIIDFVVKHEKKLISEYLSSKYEHLRVPQYDEARISVSLICAEREGEEVRFLLKERFIGGWKTIWWFDGPHSLDFVSIWILKNGVISLRLEPDRIGKLSE